jgi:hypothetical protein
MQSDQSHFYPHRIDPEVANNPQFRELKNKYITVHQHNVDEIQQIERIWAEALKTKDASEKAILWERANTLTDTYEASPSCQEEKELIKQMQEFDPRLFTEEVIDLDLYDTEDPAIRTTNNSK